MAQAERVADETHDRARGPAGRFGTHCRASMLSTHPGG